MHVADVQMWQNIKLKNGGTDWLLVGSEARLAARHF